MSNRRLRRAGIGDGSSTDDMQVEPTVEMDAFDSEAPGEEPLWVIRSKRVDQFCTVRTRVLLTPVTCDICGLNLAELNHLPPYEDLSPVVQAELKGALADHKRQYHSTADFRVVRESDLPRQWLSRG